MLPQILLEELFQVVFGQLPRIALIDDLDFFLAVSLRVARLMFLRDALVEV